MTVAQKQPKWTVDQFLAWHERQEEQYELVNGVPVLSWAPVSTTPPGATAPIMMTGASLPHSKVDGNLVRLVGNQSRGGPCGVFASHAAVKSDLGRIRYPDLVVDCGTKLDKGYILEHPKLVVEILSPSTRSFDLAGEITEHWQIESLAHVIIIDTEQRRVQLHSRRDGRTPVLRSFDDQEDAFDISELDVALRLADIFEGLVSAPEQ